MFADLNLKSYTFMIEINVTISLHLLSSCLYLFHALLNMMHPILSSQDNVSEQGVYLALHDS